MISSNLKKVRIEKGFSQSYVAKIAQISLRMYQYYEANIKVPSVYAALGIAKALESTVEELFPLDNIHQAVYDD